jgi:exopolysaccharide biosynthesis protein
MIKKILLLLATLLACGVLGFFLYKYIIQEVIIDNSDVLGSSTQSTTTYPRDGYSYISVKTNVGTFNAYVYKASLSKVTVKTVAANKSTCKNNCPTKTLKQYVDENKAVAGMNGTYFCPPDYSNCKGKVNSFDFAFYNSNQKVWLNKNALSWNKTAIALFKGKSVKFCMDTTKCSTSGVTAAISNYPALVQEGKIVVEKGDVQPYQRNKGIKGAIGSDGKNIYLVLMPNTTITEAAYVARALGMINALNVDGGGSSAMYVGGFYKIGPGRSLPNAIVLTQ